MKRAAILMLLSTLTACGGGTSTTIPFAPSKPGVPTGQTSALAKFTITVPPKIAQARSRKPEYVSVNTQSVVVTLNSVNGVAFSGAQDESAVNLTPNNPACTGTPLTCTITVPAAVGTDGFTVNTYDVQQSSASPTTPAGHVLSTGTVSATVTAGQSNVTTPLVLNGIAASFSATFPSDPHISAINSGGAPGYAIVGNQPYLMTIAPLDASGATIVGSGAPTFSVSVASSALAVTPGASAGTFTVAVKSFSATPAIITITPSLGATENLPIQTVEELWMGSAVQNGSITAYALSATPSQITADTIATTGTATPEYLAFDANGVLWVSDFHTGQIYAYSVAGTPSQIAGDTINLGGTGPLGLAFDANGNLWIALFALSTVVAYDFPPGGAPYNISSWSQTNYLNSPTALAFDAHQNLWVAMAGNTPPSEPPNIVGLHVPAGTLAGGMTTSLASTANDGIAFDSNGNLWATNLTAGTVQEFTLGSTSIVTPITGLNSPEGIAFDGNGNLWVAATQVLAYRINGSSATQITGDTINLPFNSQVVGLAITP